MPNHPASPPSPRQADDQPREQQRSHGDTQNRTKKDGHTDQIGTGGNQTSQRQRGGGARRTGP
ncbi:hypothetical protein EGT29_16150 [Pigmentiphaga sp. H8]|uniref:Uncharacterized protein n=1 Tax=Pigmentiphaga daeguensis TaxID=414049 RepID=A0ABN1CMM2_9BURK|nr:MULTISPECIES: hypothetical protein [unclassified Pigmentiphaga]AZG09268.1 hypothetical protein EGT29_16150 [Pigmentiphaga sp. H8]MDH2235805.1 hypothetical protein [Pigmentiphaga sp. GD03639]OVZ62927.1 hypothetical protein CDO46_14470 [Pigmentiphaga sp. NML030171]